MIINIYSTADDKRVIDKTLTLVMENASCQLVEGCSALDPVVKLSMNAAVYTANYMYIPYFGRYYYITNIEVIEGNVLRISGHVDVLKTYSAQLKNCTINTRRNENNYDMYLPDDRPVESRYIRYSKDFPTSFDDYEGSYILITVGNGTIPLTE